MGSLWGPLAPSIGGAAITAGWPWWAACEAVEEVLGEACEGVDMGWVGSEATPVAVAG